MELGTGIFLSTIVLAVLILYGITKDRWSWRRIIKRTALIVVGLTVLGTLIGVVAYQWEQVVPTKVGRQTEYAGLRLGMTQDEVMYVKGFPPYVLAFESDPQWKGFMKVVDTKNFKKGEGAIDYRDWLFKEYEHDFSITFNPARTAVTIIQCISNDKGYRCPTLGGVRDGDSEKEVLRKLGNPTSSEIDGGTKEMSYRDLNIRFRLTKEQVYMLALIDPSHWHPSHRR